MIIPKLGKSMHLSGEHIAIDQFTNDPLGNKITKRCAIGWIRFRVCKKSYTCQMNRLERKMVDEAVKDFTIYLKDNGFLLKPGSGIRPVLLWSDSTLVSTVAATLNNFFAGYFK